MIKAVIIDFDDTLCLTEAVCFDLENEVLVRMGRPKMSREVHLKTWGKPLFEAIIERSPGVDVEEYKKAYHPVIAEFIESGKLDAIAKENYETLDNLIKSGKLIMILTSRTHGEVKHLIHKDHLLSSRVKAFYYRDNMQFHKPDPRAFGELLAENNLQPAQCVYVGDSRSDAEAAYGAGLYFIASLESGLREKQDFNGTHVNKFINKFSELDEAVRDLENQTS